MLAHSDEVVRRDFPRDPVDVSLGDQAGLSE